MNLTSFLVWRLKLKVRSQGIPRERFQHLQYSFQASGYCKAELRFFTSTAQTKVGWYNGRRAVPSESDTSRTLNLKWKIRLLYTRFAWNVPKKYLKVLTFPVTLGNTTIFICKLPIRLFLKMWRFSCFNDFGFLWLRLLYFQPSSSFPATVQQPFSSL